MAPPPVAPPPPPLPGSGGSKDLEAGGTGCLSPKIPYAGFVDSGQEQRSISPLCLSSISSGKPWETENSFVCHTLPRVSQPTSSAFSNSVNAQVGGSARPVNRLQSGESRPFRPLLWCY